MRGLVVLSARTCPRAVHGLVVDHGVELHRAFYRGAALVQWWTCSSKKLHLTNRQTDTNRQIVKDTQSASRRTFTYILV